MQDAIIERKIKLNTRDMSREKLSERRIKGKTTTEGNVDIAAGECHLAGVCDHHCMRFRLRASSGSSSSVRSAVSAGLSSECTLDAMLDRRVGGPGVSIPLKGYLAPGNVHPLSALNVDGILSLDNGGVPCIDDACRGPRGSWYDSNASRSCWSPPPIGGR